LRRERFYRIIGEIKKGEVKNKKDKKDILELVREFSNKESENRYFLVFEANKPKVMDEVVFEKFVRYYLGCNFEEFQEAKSKKELIEIFKDSKSKNIHTSDITIVHRKRDKLPQIFYDEFEPKINGRVVVVENYESFLRIDFDLFDEEDFIYLGGFSNKKTTEFLRDKDILFFGDFDFYGMMIFDTLVAKSKEFFIPNNLEYLFKNYANKELYLKQKFIEDRVKRIDFVYELIKRYFGVVEQEILNK
jgi:hypothetical protein